MGARDEASLKEKAARSDRSNSTPHRGGSRPGCLSQTKETGILETEPAGGGREINDRFLVKKQKLGIGAMAAAVGIGRWSRRLLGLRTLATPSPAPAASCSLSSLSGCGDKSEPNRGSISGAIRQANFDCQRVRAARSELSDQATTSSHPQLQSWEAKRRGAANADIIWNFSDLCIGRRPLVIALTIKP